MILGKRLLKIMTDLDIYCATFKIEVYDDGSYKIREIVDFEPVVTNKKDFIIDVDKEV